MDVLIDTNVLLADPWLESEKMRALFDFLKKTRSRLLVHEVSLQEADAAMGRRWRDALEQANAALADLRRLKVSEPTLLPVEDICAEVRERWTKATRLPLLGSSVIPTDSTLLPQVLHRAVNRIPPCARRGEEFRDAIIWLGALRFCESKDIHNVAFISGNTRDFADRDGRLLPVLVEDAIAHKVRISYFPSLDDFLREHAQPIEWLTREWIAARVDQEEIEELVWDAFKATDARDFNLSWHLDGEGWEVRSGPEVIEVSTDLDEIYVWEYGEEEIVVFISYFATGSAYFHCFRDVLEQEGPPSSWWTYRDEVRIKAEANLVIEFAARIVGGEVLDLKIDDVSRG